MHAVCTQENLAQALFALERVVGKQTSLPILSNILIQTEKGQLKLSATNLEIGVVVVVGAKITKEGGLTVPAKLLSTFIQNLPSGQVVELEQKGLELRLTSERHTVSIKGLDGKDFPIIPRAREVAPLALPAQSLKEALQKVLFSVSLNESRIELTGVHFLFGEESIAIAATDSFRLGEYTLSLSGDERGETYDDFRKEHPTLLIPAATLQELVRVIQIETQTVTLSIEENQLFFDVGGVNIISRIINGRYPDYQQIIPKTFSSRVSFNKEDMLRALKMATSFSLYGSGEVMLTFSGERHEVSVSAESQEVGTNRTELSIEGETSGETSFLFNPRYLLEGMATFPGETITYSFNSSTTPILLRSSETEFPLLYIVMPIRK